MFSKYFSSTNQRSYEDAIKNISLILINDHFTEGVVRPNVNLKYLEPVGVCVTNSNDFGYVRYFAASKFEVFMLIGSRVYTTFEHARIS